MNLDDLLEVGGGCILLSANLIAFETKIDPASGDGLLDIDEYVTEHHLIGEEYLLIELKVDEAELVSLDIMLIDELHHLVRVDWPGASLLDGGHWSGVVTEFEWLTLVISTLLQKQRAFLLLAYLEISRHININYNQIPQCFPQRTARLLPFHRNSTPSPPCTLSLEILTAHG